MRQGSAIIPARAGLRDESGFPNKPNPIFAVQPAKGDWAILGPFQTCGHRQQVPDGDLFFSWIIEVGFVFGKKIDDGLIERLDGSLFQGYSHQRAEHAFRSGFDVPWILFVHAIEIAFNDQSSAMHNEQALKFRADFPGMRDGIGQGIRIHA